MHLIWLGASDNPGAPGVGPFWPVISNMRVAGMPQIKTPVLPSMFRDGPITMPEAGLSCKPALSPLLIGVMVRRLWSGIAKVKILI